MSGDESFGRNAAVPYKYRKLAYRVSIGVSAVIVAIVGAFPMYWMAQNAFKTRSALNDGVSFFPTAASFTFERFDVVLSSRVFGYIVNSLIVTAGTIVVVVTVSLIAGYGLARFEFRGKSHFARVLLFGYMFAPIVLALPLYLIWDRLGLLNTHLGLILALSALTMPFTVWLMWKFMQSIPRSLEESAWIQGAPRWRGFVDIVLPQAKPAIIANALFAFAIAWNDFTFAQVLLPREEATTFPPGILRLINSSWETGYGDMMAAALMMTVPPLLFAYFLQSYLLEGFEVRSI
jgi:multiple sugar transport system permease protein